MYALQLDNVTKHFADKIAVNQVNFQVDSGQIFGLLGGNGAGKTTTMRMVLNLIYPDAGRILWKGRQYFDQLRQLMGYLPEERGLYPKVKVCDQLIYLAELRGMKHKAAEASLHQWLERFEIPEYYHQKVEELSKGNQQKIQFIAAIIHHPEILILDEAFSGLDPVNVEIFKKTVIDLRNQGKTMLFSSHRMDHVEELCEEICIMNKSNVVLQGNLRQIKASYPKERILLNTASDVEGLSQIDGVTAVNKMESGYEIRISQMNAAEPILKLAMSQSTVLHYQIMEPTLNEIFIKKVGKSND